MNLLKPFLTVAAVTVASLCLPFKVSAQTEASIIDTAKVYTLNEVIISASRIEENPSMVGRNVTVISREDIEESLAFNLADLLTEQESIHMIGNNQTPGSLQQGFLRNSNSRHSVIMVDGVRISDPSTVNNSADLSEISLAGVERIEIVRGSHSTLYGSSAIGGVINIITKKKGVEGFNMDFTTDQSLFNRRTWSTRNNMMANFTTASGFYADAGFSHQYSNGLDATIDTVTSADSYNPQDRDEFRKLDLIGKVGFKTEKADLYLSYRNEDQNSDLDQGAYNDDDNANVDFYRDLVSYGASYVINNQLEIGYEGAYSDLGRDFINDSSLVSAVGDFDGIYVETNASGTLWENGLTTTLRTDHLKSILGFESSVQTMDSRNYVFSRSSFGVFEQVTDLDSLDLRESINSAFIHAEINGDIIGESMGPLSLVLGTRYSHHNKFGGHITYEVNPKLRLANSSLVYAALTTGYNAPSLYQLNTPEQGFGAYTSRGNPNLDPEKSISYELGWKQDVGGVLDLEVSLFRTVVSDVIEYVYLWEGNTAINDLTGADYLGDTYLNISRQEINGLELGIDFRASSKVGFSGNLSLTDATLIFSPEDINQTYTGGNHVQIFESGAFVNERQKIEGLTRRPQVSAMMKAEYRPVSKIRFMVSTQFVGSRDDVFYSSGLGPFGAQDRSQVSGYNITDLSMSYRLTEDVSVAAKVSNVFDTDYIEINGFRTRGRGVMLSGKIGIGSF